MGAGVQRWWVDADRYQVRCDQWRQQKQLALSRAVITARVSELLVLRRVLVAFDELWKVVP